MKWKSLPYSILKNHRLGVQIRLKRTELNFELYHLLKQISDKSRLSWTRDLEKCMTLLIKGKPLSHILQNHPFLQTNLRIYPKVLVPRNETEDYLSCLIKKIILNRKLLPNTLRILDLCSGSGCIAIALASNITKIEVFAVDKSLRCCLNVISNAILNKDKITSMGSSIKIKRADLFSNMDFLPKFDVIISNPPYIPLMRKNKVEKNVLRYENRSALFPYRNYYNGLLFHSKILEKSQKLLDLGPNLNILPKILMEFDGRYQIKNLKYIAKSNGFNNIKFRNDFQSIPRSAWIY